MSNINRDYLIVLNPKTSKVTVPELNYYIYDKYTANLFVNLVTVENGKVVNMVDADQYKLVLHVLKPTNEIQTVENIQVFNKEKALFQIELDAELTKNIGRYKCELLTIDKTDHIVQSAKFSYRVKKSIYNDLDVVTETPQYPIIITLLDKLQDIDKYEEERRANEVARVAAEKARVKDYTDLRKTVTTDIDTMQQKIDSFDGKVQEVDNAVTQMRTNITDYQTKKNTELDNYKTQKDTQINTAIKGMETTIDKYKTAKDTEINAKITQQDTKIDSAINTQNTNIQASTKALNDKLDAAVQDQNNTIAANNQAQNEVISDAVAAQNKTINTVVENDKKQNDRLDGLEYNDTVFITDIEHLQIKDTAHEDRMTAIEAVDVEQNNRLDAIEIKNDQQDGRLNDVEAKNKKQDLDLKCLFAESHSERITLDNEVGNSVFLQNSKQGFATIDELKGNTLVNCNKDTDKELILNGNIDTSGYGTVTTTEGVDGGKVDVALEGNTMVNVCDQEEPIAITKSYEVTTGNHIALQGEYDGKCRPNIYGNTMVNLRTSDNCGISISDKSLYTQTYKSNRRLAGTVVSAPAWVYVDMGRLNMSLFKPNTKYTVIFNNTTKIKQVQLQRGDIKQVYSNEGKIVDNKAVLTTVSNLNEFKFTDADCIYCYLNMSSYPVSFDCEIIGILEGDYTNKPIPDYFAGMKSSFEDKLVPENLSSSVSYNGQINKKYATLCTVDTSKLKRNTIYTTFIKNDGEEDIQVYSNNTGGNFNFSTFTIPAKSSKVVTISTKDSELDATKNVWLSLYATETLPQNISAYLLEGDYTNYDFTDYDSTKVGKYKVDYKVTGKNLIDLSTEDNQWDISNLSVGETYTIQTSRNIRIQIGEDTNTNVLVATTVANNITFTYDNKYAYKLRMWELDWSNVNKNTLQFKLYQSNKEYTKTLYLNSPLLEGDTIEDINGKATHVHRYGKVVLDGSNDEKWIDNAGEGDTINGHSIYASVNIYSNGECMCDKLPVYNSSKEVENLTDFVVLYNNGLVVVNVKGATTIKEVKSWLQSNPITLISKLKTPTYETISNDSILCDSYVNGHLDVDSAVPIDKVVFKTWGKNLKYLYPSTEYTIQFESDNAGILYGLNLNNSDSITNLNIVKGINKFTISTSDTITASYLWTNGIGFNASKVVVTPKVDNNFGYFKGMKSVGECEGNKIEVVAQNKNLFDGKLEAGSIGAYTGIDTDSTSGNRSIGYTRIRGGAKYYVTKNSLEQQKQHLRFIFYDKNKEYISYSDVMYNSNILNVPNRAYYLRLKYDVAEKFYDISITEGTTPTNYVEHKHNKQTLTHEPLRGLPNGTKDKYVIIDGKWYIERNCGVDNQLQIRNWLRYDLDEEYPNVVGFYTEKRDMKIISALQCDKFKCLNADAFPGKLTRNDEFLCGGNIGTPYFKISIYKNKLETLDVYGFKKWLSENNVTIVYPLQTPTYEPIDYNPFEVYTDTTHISNNSTIPCNMVIRNSGFNCILKPNTTYTVSSNNGLSTVSTKDSIGDGILRFYDKDTTSITKMSNVLVLEGDYVTGNPPIPAFFKGMESAFEQELVTDEKDEHYGKYKVNVKATNPDNSQQNNITFYLKEPLRGVGDVKDKVYVKEDKVVVERNCSSVTFDGSEGAEWKQYEDVNSRLSNVIGFFTEVADIEYRNDIKNILCNCLLTTSYNEKDEEGCKLGGSPHIHIYVPRVELKTQDLDGFKQWLQQNPTTVVYQLATPTYEEVEYFDLKLFVEIFKDTTIIYNSNIPVTSTINYTYSTPLTDAVNTVSDISDEQDSMIIDMATQVATMEMMLM